MADEDRPADGDPADTTADLGHKLDTVAAALAAIAITQTDLLARMAEADARRSHDAAEVAQRLDAVERQVLALPPPAIPPPPGAPGAANGMPVDLEPLRADLALCLDVLTRVAEGVASLDSRTEDRLAAVRDAALAPAADLQVLLSARNERQEAQLGELAGAVQALVDRPAPAPPAAASDGSAVLLERVEELAGAVQSLTWQLPELTTGLVAVREQVERIGTDGSLPDATEELGEELAEQADRVIQHTDSALAGVLRLMDERLTALRTDVADAGTTSASGGFEAGAVMGAAQAAWNRLEQRLDTEFDDLGRQLQSMAALIEAAASAEASANRPVATGEQLRRAASAVKDTVVSASRSRRDRRGGPRGLGSGGG